MGTDDSLVGAHLHLLPDVNNGGRHGSPGWTGSGNPAH